MPSKNTSTPSAQQDTPDPDHSPNRWDRRARRYRPGLVRQLDHELDSGNRWSGLDGAEAGSHLPRSHRGRTPKRAKR